MLNEIFEVIDTGDVEALRRALAADPGAAAARDEQGLSVATRARYRSRELVEVVLAADAPLDAWDRLLLGLDGELPPPDAWSPDGFTPLHLAAFGPNADAARRLLDAGADPDVLARAPFARVTPLGTAAFAGAVEVARVLLEHGVDTELTADGGGTPLHSAAANGNRELVELLVAHGADRAAATDDGRTPADVAADSEIAALVRA